MSFDLSDDELERQLAMMLHERAASLSDRAPVDRAVVKRARRRRTTKLASIGSGIALAAAVLVVVVLSVGTPFSTSSKPTPASPTPSMHLTAPSTQPAPVRTGWSTLPPAPISARAASATAITGDAFVVWGGEGQHHERLDDGAWYDTRTGAWHTMRASPLPTPSYPAGHHFTIAQAIGDSVVIVNDGAVAQYTPATDTWKRLPDVPLAQLDNLALTENPNGNAIVLTGAFRNGGAGYAALNFDAGGGSPVWTTRDLSMGRSVGRPVLTATGLDVFVRQDQGGLYLDTIVGIAGEQSTHVIPNLPDSFVPTASTGSAFLGGRCKGCESSTLVLVDETSKTVRTVTNAYDACAAQHVWTGRVLVSWGAPGCLRQYPVGFDPSTDQPVRVPHAPIVDRRASDFAVASDGRVIVWGGEDASGRKLADGAILNLG